MPPKLPPVSEKLVDTRRIFQQVRAQCFRGGSSKNDINGHSEIQLVRFVREVLERPIHEIEKYLGVRLVLVEVQKIIDETVNQAIPPLLNTGASFPR